MYGWDGHARPARVNAAEFYSDKKTIALVRAAGKGDIKRIDALVSEGVDVNARGKDGFTPIMGALARLNLAGVKRLLQLGANPNVTVIGGDSAISLAAKIDDPRFLQAMLEYSGDANYVNPRTAWSLLHEATISYRMKSVELLTQHGANLNVQDRNGETPLMLASNLNRYVIAYYLLQHGADYKLTNNIGKTVVNSIEDFPIDPKSDGYVWKNKVIKYLRDRGVMVNLKFP